MIKNKAKEIIPIRRNKNGHVVLDLHYTYDPEKKQEDWIKEAEKAYPGGRQSLAWRREMEMDWSAGSGELVFPEFLNLESNILVDPYDIPKTSKLYGGLDWGDNNPCSFHVYEYSVDNTVTVIWEWYQKHISSAVAAAQAIHLCPFYKQLEWIAADPMIWTNNQYSQNTKTSLANILMNDISEDLRIYNLKQALHRSDTLMIQKLRVRLFQAPPTFRISKICTNMINEFRNLRYKEAQGDVNNSDAIVNKNNHTWDDCKYFLLSHPSSGSVVDKPKYGTYGYLNEIAQQAEEIATSTGREVQDVFNDLYESPRIDGMTEEMD